MTYSPLSVRTWQHIPMVVPHEIPGKWSRLSSSPMAAINTTKATGGGELAPAQVSTFPELRLRDFSLPESWCRRWKVRIPSDGRRVSQTLTQIHGQCNLNTVVHINRKSKAISYCDLQDWTKKPPTTLQNHFSSFCVYLLLFLPQPADMQERKPAKKKRVFFWSQESNRIASRDSCRSKEVVQKKF